MTEGAPPRAAHRIAWAGTGLVTAGILYDLGFWLVLTDHHLIHPFNLVMWMFGVGFLVAYGLGPILAAIGASLMWRRAGPSRSVWVAAAATGVSVLIWIWLLLSPPIGI